MRSYEINSKLLLQILPKPTDRAFLCGMTGCGKTKLAEVLLSQRQYVVVHDAKGEIDWAGYHIVNSLQELIELRKKPKIIYRPTVEELDNEYYTNEFFRWIYTRRNCTVYVDEVYAITSSAVRVPDYLLACLTRGRSRNVSLFASTQRPKSIPIVFMSESENNYIFHLTQESDRKRIDENTVITSEEIKALKKRFFIYSNIEGYKTKPLTLHLKKG